MKNIILCGGVGSRLWPLSRTLMPKQFVKLFDDKSLFQLTVERNSKLCDEKIIVSNAEQYFLALDQLEEINEDQNKYILEPIGRNTAPAIALACMGLDKDEIVLVTPSDHLIKNMIEYKKVLNKAKAFAENGSLVTFGITPTSAETGFGYVEGNGFDVKAFHEKPDKQTAKEYLKSGNYYWNSGMFCFKVGVFLEELKKYSLDIYSSCKSALSSQIILDGNQFKIKLGDMKTIPSESVDYAVMEKSDKLKIIPSDIGWSDLGSFDSLADELPNDENNNLVLSRKETNLIDVEDLIVVDTEDALLISKKGSSQKIKGVVEGLKKEKSKLSEVHVTAYRPWGNYTVLEDTPEYKVKNIVVKPGKRLSLQKHHHRNEHWIVVSGTATVTVGEESKLIRANESTYIKMGEVHRLANNGKIPLVMIEAQIGKYTGEDDIIRLEDDFKYLY